MIARGLVFHDADICDPTALARACSGVNVIFHEAAIPSVPKSVLDPVARTAPTSTAPSAFSSPRATPRCGRVVYAASSSAYGDTPTLPEARGHAAQSHLPLCRAKALRRALPQILHRRLRAGNRLSSIFQCLRSQARSLFTLLRRARPLHHHDARGRSAHHLRRRRPNPATSLTSPMSSKAIFSLPPRPLRRSAARSSTSPTATASRSTTPLPLCGSLPDTAAPSTTAKNATGTSNIRFPTALLPAKPSASIPKVNFSDGLARRCAGTKSRARWAPARVRGAIQRPGPWPADPPWLPGRRRDGPSARDKGSRKRS